MVVIWFVLPGASCDDEIRFPKVGEAGSLNNLAVGRGSVDHFAAAYINTGVSDCLAVGAEEQDITDLKVAHGRDLLPVVHLRITGCIVSAARGTGLFETVINKSGTVERARSDGTRDIRVA